MVHGDQPGTAFTEILLAIFGLALMLSAKVVLK